ncbi:CRISPR system Cascade subunit CasC [Desulfatibacillum alkenivorans DSM 16219]|jgi:CRISPR system Cascade subunit CasC|uniref:CRISPR system Cascade subunit CasC n=1 Tax=Desulfatibacillum alkenivorans DSM 16219 TaxID=1121393 RepID=A0A1M6YAP4_9BACT|nr:type I-E CRISPR-associated protein Cas7/Cse4/CasC [Desulfatibacillum alkenivorans]SHL15311.1 CRISPR system Cascade subunit CasC [Desulfatibacillum alkenivorans DSM 16219]
MKTIIEIHALQNYAPSNLNRDDTGAPKDAWFGGARRARISSQCLKRAVRQHFSELVDQNTLAHGDLASRTKRILQRLSEIITAQGRDENEAEAKIRAALASVKLTIKDDGKSQYLLFLGNRELENIANIISESWDSIKELPVASNGDEKKSKKKAKAAQVDPDLKKALENVFNGGKALDVALFGRMLADMPEKNQDAACQVAHAISTHAVDREFDFYTAVDDLKPEDTAGADMMGTIEFNSACFYRYAVLDWDKLVKNLQGDKDLALKGIEAFINGFVIAEPTGKQNTFAAHNPPEFVMASVRRDAAPRNLANAFETPVFVRKNQSLTKESAQELAAKAKVLQDAYGGEGKNYILNLLDAQVNGLGQKADSLQDLVQKTLNAVKE